MTAWIPPWKAHPVERCAVDDCDGWRFEDGTIVRRWCRIHCSLRDQVIKAEGGVLLQPLVSQWQRKPT